MTDSVRDPRFSIYEDLHHDQIVRQEEANRTSARLILSLLFERFRPGSVLDVGCGIGTWLAMTGEMGVVDQLGLEGEWLDRKLLQVPQQQIRSIDLESEFDLERRFDLVISLEVAEHLSAQAADRFIGSLTRHADVVLFSAAIPFQGGHHHVNEQFPEYWQALFDKRGYVAVDFIRPQIWYCNDVLLWLRQNILIFTKERLTEDGQPFSGIASGGPLSIVHPEMYMWRIESAQGLLQEHGQIADLLASGKTISASRNPDGSLAVRVKEEGN